MLWDEPGEHAGHGLCAVHHGQAVPVVRDPADALRVGLAFIEMVEVINEVLALSVQLC